MADCESGHDNSDTCEKCVSYFQDQPSDLSNSEWVKYILMNTLKVYLDKVINGRYYLKIY